MLREILSANKVDGPYERHWYQNDNFDLYVWLARDGSIMHFQLAYDKPKIEKAIDWKIGNGFMHYRLRDHGRGLGGPMTPLLDLDPDFPKQRVVREFQQSAGGIDIGVAAFVTRMLQRAPAHYYRDDKAKWIAAGVLCGALLILWRIL
jgi:hypothetical protein